MCAAAVETNNCKTHKHPGVSDAPHSVDGHPFALVCRVVGASERLLKKHRHKLDVVLYCLYFSCAVNRVAVLQSVGSRFPAAANPPSLHLDVLWKLARSIVGAVALSSLT